jgi:hypothetical protein
MSRPKNRATPLQNFWIIFGRSRSYVPSSGWPDWVNFRQC